MLKSASSDFFHDRPQSGDERILDSLSAGQCEVLDLLLAGYETNKQIAQMLKIAPSTVAQRLALASNKLRTSGRSATKREYERLRKACAFPVYSPQHIPISAVPPQQPPRDWGATPTLQLNDAMPFNRIAPWANRVERPTSLEAFVEKLNAVPAVTIIVAQAVLLTILAVAVLAAMGTFSEYDFLRFVTQ